MTSAPARSSVDPFRHDVLLYAGIDEFCSAVASFVEDAVSGDEPVLVVAAADKLARLRGSVDERRVRLADMAALGTNPARIIPAWREFADEHQGRPVRGVGEPIPPTRSAAEVQECQRLERLANLAFADSPGLWLLCPYDIDTLAAEVIDEATRSHPSVIRDGRRAASAVYVGDERTLTTGGGHLAPPPATAAVHPLRPGRLNALRAFVAERAAAVGLIGDRVGDLVLAVNEVATNTMLYGGGHGVVRVWRDQTVVCEITDAGVLADPLAGGLRPGDGEGDSRGLWIVNQLCDLVQVRSTSRGTIVRLHVRVPIGDDGRTPPAVLAGGGPR